MKNFYFWTLALLCSTLMFAEKSENFKFEASTNGWSMFQKRAVSPDTAFKYDGQFNHVFYANTSMASTAIIELCGNENFDNAELTPAYIDGSFVGNNGVTWTYVASRDENGDENNSGIDGNAIMLRRVADGSKITSSAVPGGISDFSAKLYKGFSGGGDRQAELFVNGVSQGLSDGFDDFDEHLFSVTGIDIAGDVIIEIRNATSKQLIVDDITWTCFSGGGQTYDCPDISANIGDSCDDGNELTENDVITDDCECVGTPIIYDCPAIQANIGDSCDDGDATTANDVITQDCECVGTPIIVGDVCGFENFDNFELSGTSYVSGSFIGNNGVTWTYVGARDKASTSGIDGNAIMFKDIGANITSSAVAGGITDFAAKLYKGFSGAGDRQVELFVNGVSQGLSAGFDDNVEHIFSVTGINISGDVIIEIRNAQGKQVVVDDITWTCYTDGGGEPECPVPTDLAVDNITENSADISWVGGGTTNQWHVKYGPIGFDPNQGTGESATGDPTMTITGLDDGTAYEFYVSGGCATEWSAFAGPVSFTTLASPLSCDAPTDITIVEVTATTVTVSWSRGGNEESWAPAYGYAGWYLDDNDPIDFELGVTDTEYTFENLEPNTAYDFHIYSECGEEEMSDLVGPISFTTLATFDCPEIEANIGDSCDDGNPNTGNDVITEDCECVGTPILVGDICGSENFDNAELTDQYANGSFIGNDGITWTYVESRDENGDENNSGINGNAIMLRRSSDDSKITSSTVTGGISDFAVKLYKGFTGGGDRQVELFVNDVSQGVSEPFDDNNEHIFTITGINISGDVVIEIRNITGKQVILDDIIWTCGEEVSEPCDAPTLVEASNITQNTADIIWSGGSQFGTWIVAYGVAPYLPQEADEDLVFDMEYDLTGLDAGTEYQVYVRAACDDDLESLSDWTSTSFTTTAADIPCIAPTYTTSTTLDCDAGDTGEYTVNFNFTDLGNAESIELIDDQSNQPIMVSETGDYVAGPYAEGTTVIINVNVGDADCNSSETFFEECEVVVEPCDAPTLVEANNITGSSADITWSGGSESGIWIVAYGVAPYLPQEADEDVALEMEYDLTGLESGTEYQFFVRTACDEDLENLSDWTSISFTTDASTTFDCPEIEANFGDVCYDTNQNEGVIDEDCNCFVAPPVFDCPEIEANFGDVCYDANQNEGVIDENCDCFVDVEPEPCGIPYQVELARTSGTTATFNAGNTDWHYQGSANRAGRPLRPYPMYGMNDMTVPHTQYALVPQFEYDIWLRTICGDGSFSAWAGPYYLPTYEGGARRAPTMSLLPNPAVAVVQISRIEARTIEVFDMNGGYIKTFTTTDNQIDLTGLPTGKYNLRVIDAQGDVHFNQVIKK